MEGWWWTVFLCRQIDMRTVIILDTSVHFFVQTLCSSSNSVEKEDENAVTTAATDKRSQFVAMYRDGQRRVLEDVATSLKIMLGGAVEGKK